MFAERKGDENKKCPPSSRGETKQQVSVKQQDGNTNPATLKPAATKPEEPKQPEEPKPLYVPPTTPKNAKEANEEWEIIVESSKPESPWVPERPRPTLCPPFSSVIPSSLQKPRSFKRIKVDTIKHSWDLYEESKPQRIAEQEQAKAQMGRRRLEEIDLPPLSDDDDDEHNNIRFRHKPGAIQ